MRDFLFRACLLASLLPGAVAADDAGPGTGPRIPGEEFHARRVRACALLDSGSAAVFRAADPRWRNGDVDYPYRQESNYLYLTGLNEPSGVLVMTSSALSIGSKAAQIIHVGGMRQADSVAQYPDVEELFVGKERLQEVLRTVASKVRTLYVSAPDLRFVNDWLNDKPMFIERDARKQFEKTYTGVKTKSAGTFVGRLREIKSQREVDVIRHAIALTGEGITRALQACRPGDYEYVLQAAIESGMRGHGADGVSFPSIVGSGPNSLIPHYDRNDRRMEEGDVVVMDVGAEYQGYAADVTRTIPVSGRFTDEQRKIYEVVRTAHDEIIKLIKPGVPSRVLEEKARQVIGEAGYKKFIVHGVSHQLGLDVHDVGVSDTLRAGMVITVEPGIYIPLGENSLPAGFRGMGVRLEDDVLVTPTGAEVLSQSIPIDPSTIEDLMR